MPDKKLTPMMELIEFMKNRIKDSSNLDEQRTLNGMIYVCNDFIEKERQMVIDAWLDGQSEFKTTNAEQYYTQTYKS